MAIWTKYGPTNRAICFWKKGCEVLQPKSVWPEKYSDFLFPLFERLQKMSSLFREKTIDTILHMRIINAEIQNLRREIFHLLKEKNVLQRLLATILLFSAAFTQTEISSYSDVDKQSRCLCSTNRLLQIWSATRLTYFWHYVLLWVVSYFEVSQKTKPRQHADGFSTQVVKES